jgi:hypothetical protein
MDLLWASPVRIRLGQNTRPLVDDWTESSAYAGYRGYQHEIDVRRKEMTLCIRCQSGDRFLRRPGWAESAGDQADGVGSAVLLVQHYHECPRKAPHTKRSEDSVRPACGSAAVARLTGSAKSPCEASMPVAWKGASLVKLAWSGGTAWQAPCSDVSGRTADRKECCTV